MVHNIISERLYSFVTSATVHSNLGDLDFGLYLEFTHLSYNLDMSKEAAKNVVTH